jgi:uncharacterized protein (TIGR04255 family)
MPFPDSPRVVYNKNPLDQVICQLRFPPILKIDSDVPAQFQEEIRQKYPLFQQKTVPSDLMPPQEVLEALPPAIRESLFHSSRRSYEFTSADEYWTVTLTRDFLALTSRRYERWEQFKENFSLPLKYLLEIYEPTFFTRIGLRYQNVICRSRLGLQDVPWSELLKPYIAGEFTQSEVAEHILESRRTVMFQLTNSTGLARMQHGLFSVGNNGHETCYLIDNDFYIDNQKMIPELENVWNVLNQFKLRARRLFRWCITDRLHSAMDPRAVEIST